ncbi:transposase [Ferrimicrobium sp.]|uniref:transposase n=1 Tax=Ferrimicrobium sp. TaxID=2926050 RepID=UPI002613421E|nr:transposase [Ferrimicrobium sp.]
MNGLPVVGLHPSARMPLWVHISMLDVGHPVWVPLKKNQFFDDAPGELSNFAQVTISRDRALKVTLVKRSNRAAPVTTGKDIGLDWGLNSMFASDLGDQLGRQFYPWLRKVDAQLTKINVELQRRGIKPKTNARYRRFNQRIREYVRNEVGRILNRLVKRYGIKSITLETLDLRNGSLSRRMNRILTRAARAAVKEKLKSMSETQGIEIHEVNPAHTSRECSGCGFVSNHNRKGPHFVCGFCNKRLNADTNGSRTISLRRSQGLQYPYASRQTVLQRLDPRFEARWGLKPGDAEKLRLAKERRPVTVGLTSLWSIRGLETKLH